MATESCTQIKAISWIIEILNGFLIFYFSIQHYKLPTTAVPLKTHPAHSGIQTYVEHVFVNVPQCCRNAVAALTQSYSIDEHVILILKHAGSVFWRLAPACVSLRSPIQSQMAAGIMHPILPRSAWLLPKWWWYTITDSNTHQASISCFASF